MDNNSNSKYCPHCGNILPYEAIFCGTCGYKFTENTDSPTPGYDVQQPNYGIQQTNHGSQQPSGQPPVYDGQPSGYNNQPPVYGSYPPQYKNNSGRGLKIALITISILLALSLIALGGYFIWKNMSNNNNDNDNNHPSVVTAKTSSPAPSATATAVPSPSPSATPDANSQFVLPYSSTRELTEADLAGLDRGQLIIARNEIYARHGRQFKTDWIQTHFNGCSWYTVNPYYNYSNEDSMLTSLELKNALFLLDYEKKHYS